MHVLNYISVWSLSGKRWGEIVDNDVITCVCVCRQDPEASMMGEDMPPHGYYAPGETEMAHEYGANGEPAGYQMPNNSYPVDNSYPIDEKTALFAPEQPLRSSREHLGGSREHLGGSREQLGGGYGGSRDNLRYAGGPQVSKADTFIWK